MPASVGAAHEPARNKHAAHEPAAQEHAAHEPATHEHHGAQHAVHTGHSAGHEHHGDHIARFRRLFWINLVLAIPVVAFSGMFGMLLGYEVPAWATFVSPVIGTVMYVWGGRPFLTGAVAELRARTPGMMLLIALAITVAF